MVRENKVVVSVTFPPALAAGLKALADLRGVSRSSLMAAWCQMMLRKYHEAAVQAEAAGMEQQAEG